MPHLSNIWQRQLRFAAFQQATALAVADFLAVSVRYQLHKYLVTWWQHELLATCAAGVAKGCFVAWSVTAYPLRSLYL